MILYPNQLYRFIESGEIRRILWISPTADMLASIRVNARVNMPDLGPRTRWANLAEQGQIEPITDDPFLRLVSDESLVQSSRERRDIAWSVIKNVVGDEPNIYMSDRRGVSIRELARQHGVNRDTVRNWLFAYWQRGMTRNALLPDWFKCGNRSERKKDTSAKRGRPRNPEGGLGINITESVKRLFEVAYKNRFLRNKNEGLSGAYNWLLKTGFSDAVEDGPNGRLLLRDVGSIPTKHAFYWWVRKTRDLEGEVRARQGPRFFERTLRPLLGNSTFEAIGPGFRYQIDATIADVYLVSSIDRKKIIGRPVVYVVVDVFSRLIVGVYIGLENASWTAAVMALVNATSDKVEFCKRFGIDIQPEDWPVAGLSSVVLGDRGELESRLADRMADVLGIKVENTPPYRPDWKGVVERMFGTLPAKFKAWVPGYINVDYKERGADDYRLDATLTLNEFTRIMLLSVLEHNATPVGGYPLTAEMARDGVVPIPKDIWAWGVRNRMGMLKTFAEKLVKFALMHSDTARITPSGIKFKGRYYHSAGAMGKGLYTKARADGTWTVTVSYDPRCMDEILLHDPYNQTEYEVCRLITSDSEQLGLCLQEVLELQKVGRALVASQLHTTLDKKINVLDEIERTVREAEQLKRDSGPETRSKAERTRDIRKNAHSERMVERASEKFTFSDEPIEVPSVSGKITPLTASKNRFSIPSIHQLKRRFNETEGS